jgi:DNA sulfur modification protein DndD
VILDQLTLDNVGVFAGRHTIDLTPPSPRKPVTVVGGLNGSGKTTILEAILFALYGPLARSVSGRARSYDAYLRQLVHHRGDGQAKAAVELRFHAYREGERFDYRVRRSWQIRGDKVNPGTAVYLNNQLDRDLTERWAEHVEAFMPRGIADLFFFDGEKFETLAELDNARGMLRTVIGALLGLDLVDRLDTDLSVIERNHRRQAADSDQRGALVELQERVTQARGVEESLHQEVAAARVKVERAAKRRHEQQERFRVEGGELFQRHEALQTEYKQATERLTAADRQLRELAEGAGPFLLVQDLLAEVVEQATAEIDAAETSRLATVLTERDRDIIARLQAMKVRTAAINDLETYLAEERRQRSMRADTPDTTQMSADGLAHARALQEHHLAEVQQRRTVILQQRDRATADLEDLQRQLAAMPEHEVAEQLQSDLDAAIAVESAAQRELDRAEADLTSARNTCVAAVNAYTVAVNKAAENAMQREDAQRILAHSQRVRDTLADFRTEAVKRHLSRIERLVLESLRRLLRKQDLVGDLKIDPDTFTVKLSRSDGTDLSPQQLSAGERQLLAVALLWGLAQASGRPLPVVIDTPLGRLDGQHREHLIHRYFPHASHQVVLLSTDQEIDETAWNQLKTTVGHAYHLDHPSNGTGTSIQPGYFW